MGKFELDLGFLDEAVTEKTITRIPVRGNEERMIRIAFDLFRLDGGNRDDLWQVQADDDGNQFLVRTYDLPDDEDKIQVSASWEVLMDKKYANFTIAYDGIPLKRLASKDYNIKNKQDAEIFRGIVLNKLATDKDFVELIKSHLPQGHESCGECGFKDTAVIDESFKPPFPGGIVLVMEEDMPKGMPIEKENLEESPSEEYDDATNWWENLSNEEQESLFEKFKDVSITKEQAFKLIGLEMKLAQKK